MNEKTQEVSFNFTELAAEIVSAYVANNPVPPAELPALIKRVHEAVFGLSATGSSGSATPHVEVDKPSAAQIRKSVRHEGIVSFIDGKSYKTLKRHLSANGLDPHSYRKRYGLPADYPMIAPSYTERRSAIAKAIGLGRPGAMAERQNAGRKAS